MPKKYRKAFKVVSAEDAFMETTLQGIAMCTALLKVMHQSSMEPGWYETPEGFLAAALTARHMMKKDGYDKFFAIAYEARRVLSITEQEVLTEQGPVGLPN